MIFYYPDVIPWLSTELSPPDTKDLLKDFEHPHPADEPALNEFWTWNSRDNPFSNEAGSDRILHGDLELEKYFCVG